MQQNRLTPEQIAILDFWHKIEFFLPYDLEDTLSKIKKAQQNYLPLFKQKIEFLSTEELWRYLTPGLHKDEVILGFDLFIGIYNKNELAEKLNKLLKFDTSSENVRFIGNIKNNISSSNGKGLSCCAKISLDEFGRLDPYKSGNIEVSTAPWAIGQICKNNGDVTCLDFEQFDCEMKLLKDTLADFLRMNIEPHVTKENPFPALSGKNIVQLIDVVMEWMNFSPNSDDVPHFYIYPKRGKKTRKENNKNESLKFTVEVENIQISILNSFFAIDLAKTIQAGMNNKIVGNTLISYLSKTYKYIDLYDSLEGKECIIENLKPEYINHGHWFSENSHHMSLMQQFAINTIFKEINKNPEGRSLFSVNGPPGTGKTTLLRDIFAENIVRRATALANYLDVKSTFKSDKIKIEFGRNTLELAVLQDDLTGYEMVVTSSNNAAVQNISEELPQMKALGRNWYDMKKNTKVKYLQSVARNLISCKKINKKKEYVELDFEQQPWGLIACVLGRKDKREFFVEQFTQEPDPNLNGFKEDYFDSIYTWRKRYSGPSFSKAREAFLTKQKEVKEHISHLTTYMNIVLKWRDSCEFDFEHEAYLAKLEIERNLSKLTNLIQEREFLNLNKPTLLSRLFFPKNYQCYLEKIKNNNFEQENQRHLRLLYEDKLLNIQEKQNGKERLFAKLSELRNILGYSENFNESKVKTPINMLEDLEKEQWQISGFWSDENLNQKRSELFQAALSLHEAWIAESISCGFSGNILAIKNLIGGQQLQGNPEKIEEAALLIWQSLFMMVPVASTTFASFGYLFRYLGAQSLGWIFVDEAGQAIPQAAVGAMWRAKNAIVVGDPLQIEPVFTTPEKLTDILFKASKIQVDFEVSPHKTSVQVLADKANPYGAYLDVDGESTWIGSPLRVHRRCLEPMFSISNCIAYQGKMVFGLNKKHPIQDPWLMGDSAWIHLSEGEQQEEKEVELVSNIFRQLCLQRYKDKQLPPIYIISPFKEMCEKIRTRLKENEKLWNEFGVSGGDWVNKNVGTVHTFQGKESSIVLLVLGRNQSDIIKAMPLVSKPNLLNVAATRAKDRLFLIGDYHVWKEKYECFKKALPILDNIIDASIFLEKLQKKVKEVR